MRTSIISTWPATLMIVCVFGCSHAQGLIGVWQTETFRMTPSGRTNIVESYQTIEFLKDSSFKMGSAVTTDGEKRTTVVFSGTYAFIDTNHVRLEIAPDGARPSDRVPMTVTFSIVGDQLEMSRLTSSVVPETTKYRRAKR